jgi:hypothetical protein
MIRSRLLLAVATLALAQPAAGLDVNYWRGGWAHGARQRAAHLRVRHARRQGHRRVLSQLFDATTIGFIDGTWNEKTGIDFHDHVPESERQYQDRRAAARDAHDGRLMVTPAAGQGNDAR